MVTLCLHGYQKNVEMVKLDGFAGLTGIQIRHIQRVSMVNFIYLRSVFKMFYFKERTPSLCLLETLPQIFSSETFERNLFKAEYEHNDMGCWNRIFDYLYGKFLISSKGSLGDLSWQASSTIVSLNHEQWTWRDSTIKRSARALEIHLHNQTLVAAFVPHVYNEDGKIPFADHRFVVGCTDESMIPLVILFSDVILGDETWDENLQPTLV